MWWWVISGLVEGNAKEHPSILFGASFLLLDTYPVEIFKWVPLPLIYKNALSPKSVFDKPGKVMGPGAEHSLQPILVIGPDHPVPPVRSE